MNLILPSPPLNHVPKYHVCMSFKYLQGNRVSSYQLLLSSCQRLRGEISLRSFTKRSQQQNGTANVECTWAMRLGSQITTASASYFETYRDSSRIVLSLRDHHFLSTHLLKYCLSKYSSQSNRLPYNAEIDNTSFSPTFLNFQSSKMNWHETIHSHTT